MKVVVLLAVVLSMLIPTGAAVAAPASCQQYDARGICIVQTQTPGAPGGQADATGSVTPASVVPGTCSDQVSGQVIPCQSDAGWWVPARQCYAQLQAVQPPQRSPIWGGHTDGAIYLCTFYSGPGAFPGTAVFPFWAADPPAGPPAVDPAVLAAQALSSLEIPVPTTGRYPSGALPDGRPYTVVNAYTWFWSDPATFDTLTARADSGGVWAEVSVVPTALTFTPGDGAAAVVCAGPGTAWAPANGVWAPSPTGCDYRYPHSSIDEPAEQVTAAYTIEWIVSWTASTGADGVLPPLATTSTSTFAVAEAQALVTG